MSHGSLGLPLGTSTMMSTPRKLIIINIINSTCSNLLEVVNLPPPWRSESIMPKDILSLREVNEWCSWVIDTVVPRTLQRSLSSSSIHHLVIYSSYASPSGVLKLTKAYLEVLRCIARDEVCTLDEHPDDEPINTKTFEDAGLSFAASSKGSSSSHHRNRAKEVDIADDQVMDSRLLPLRRHDSIYECFTSIIYYGYSYSIRAAQ